jgi:hypothetical protein
LTVEPRSSRGLAGAIKILKDDADLRTKMGCSGSKKIDDEFNIHKEVELLVNLWNYIKS